jgi:xanthine dehydrogenase YagT iron-sulfur-binding subunit
LTPREPALNKNPRKKRRTLSRRDFLKGVGTGALGASVAGPMRAAGAQAAPAPEELEPVERKTVSLTVNGTRLSLKVKPRETLLSVLRDTLELTGAKRTCDRGECGSCTVLLDGRPVYSCLTLAARLDGRSITTVEGLASEGKLSPLQQAFIDHDAYQCGYCTPGFLLSAAALLKENPAPTAEEIRSGLSGNICRCGNYQKIFEAVASVSAAAKTGRS